MNNSYKMESQERFTTYPVDVLLKRIYDQVKGTCQKKKFTCSLPSIQSINKKTVIMNFQELCSAFNRDIGDVKFYIDNELECTSSLFGEINMLSIDNVYPKKKIEDIITCYITTYVVCGEPNCCSGNTTLTKKDRLLILQCDDCKSHRAVPVIRNKHN